MADNYGDQSQLCLRCAGDGWIADENDEEVDCPSCAGAGVVSTQQYEKQIASQIELSEILADALST